MSDHSALKYTADHEWVRVESEGTGPGIAVVGITAYAAEQLGDIVYVDLPEAGEDVQAGGIVGEIESTKSVGELFSPLTGVIAEANAALQASPELVNADPFGEGWLIRIEFETLPDLLDEAAYTALIEGEAK